MENKEKLNQNPEDEKNQPMEEKSAVTENTANVSKETKDVKVENSTEGDGNEVAKEAPQKEKIETSKEKVEAVTEEKAQPEISEDKAETSEDSVKAEKKEAEPVKKLVEAEKEDEVKVESVIETEVATQNEKAETPEKAVAETNEKTESEVEKGKQEVSEVETATEKKEGEAEKKEEVKAESKEETPKAAETNEESAEEEDDDEEDEDEEVITEETYHSHTMEELVLELEKINEDNAIKNTKNKVGFIRLAFGRKLDELKVEAKEKFLENGGNIEEYKPEPIELDKQFNSAFSKYKSLRRQFRKQQEAQMKENLQKKNELLEEMRELVSSDESLKDTYDKFNEIQNRWKEIGMVPKAEIQILWNNYHFLVEKFFDKVKINKELRDLDLKKNLDAKIELCEKAEELLIEESINKSFKLLQEYHNEWKAIGPVPSANNDEIWERFKSASDKINERRREHYEELQSKLEENYTAKQALCVKAEELVLKPVNSAKEWGERTNEFEELFKVWRTFGPAPRKQNDEIWATFKGYMNQFYDAKKKFFKELKSEQQDNYHKKLDLVKQAEALKDSTDWNNTTKTLIGLQKDWKKIGPVPRKNSDDIWKQFRAANDFFFNAKSKHFKGQFEEEDKNLEAKKALVEEIQKTKYSDDKKENLEKIKVFQRKWSDIGNVPRKEMDKLYKAYRTAIDEQLDKLNISSVDFRNAGFKDRIDDLKKKDDNFALRKESQFIQKSIDKLKEDVLLWENNMGFFRHSKNADVLKMEFEKKIKKAKAEILVLKEKKRLIDK